MKPCKVVILLLAGIYWFVAFLIFVFAPKADPEMLKCPIYGASVLTGVFVAVMVFDKIRRWVESKE
jgi:Na+-transporting NADH:ubiquinone oxidoreductase subunit NqrB